MFDDTAILFTSQPRYEASFWYFTGGTGCYCVEVYGGGGEAFGVFISDLPFFNKKKKRLKNLVLMHSDYI